MKNVKKILAIVLALSLVLPMLSVCVNAESHSNELISKEDIQLITSEFVMANITGNPECTWNTDMRAKETPLYDADDKVVAYYIEFDNADGKPNGYLVINASITNPSVIEYGFNTEHNDLTLSGKTYYTTLGCYYSSEEMSREARSATMASENFSGSSRLEDTYDVWQTINTPNYTAQAKLQDLRRFATENNLAASRGGNLSLEGWGIYTSLPSGSWTSSDTLTSCLVGAPYYTTGNFSDGHDNHCGATAALNVLKYYGARLNYNFIAPSPASAFEYLYTNSGNGGPTLPAGMIRTLNNYISNRKSSGSIASSTAISTTQYTDTLLYRTNMVSCINTGKMPLLMIWSIEGAHWVNVVAYYTYSNGNTYVRIIDNWYADMSRYYVFESANTLNGNIGSMVSAKITK